MTRRNISRGLAAAASVAAAGLPAAAWAQQGPYFYGHMWDGGTMWGDGWHGWLLGPVMMILVLALVLVGVVVLLRWLVGPLHPHHPPTYPPAGKSALDILKERFARGEIDKDEFEERRRVLGD